MQRLKKTLRIFAVAVLFTCLWGLYQWLCFRFNMPYLNDVFNNSINPSALGGVSQVLSNLSMKRLSSVTVGPYIFAQIVLVLFSILFILWMNGVCLFSKIFDRILLYILTISLLLSTSFTAYTGIIFILIMTFKSRGKKIKLSIIIIMLILFAYYLYTVNNQIQDFFLYYLFNKFETSSAYYRIRSMKLALSYFYKYPLFGIGWGSVTSHDLIALILANSGIFALIQFILWLYRLLYESKAVKKFIRNSSELNIYLEAIKLSFMTVLFYSITTGFPYTFLHFWFIAGLLSSIVCIIREDTYLNK